MKKINRIFITPLLISMTLLSCEKNSEKIEELWLKETYVYNNEIINLEYQEIGDSIIYKDNSVNKLIESILDTPASAILMVEGDNKIYVFDNSDKMMAYSLANYSNEQFKDFKSTQTGGAVFKVYEHSNYTGAYLNYSASIVLVPSLGSWNDKISSLKGYVAGGQIAFYEDSNYGGKSFSYMSATISSVANFAESNLSSKEMSGSLWWKKYWNDKISSFRTF
ncbi:MAG: peptidase inhibitor family I36 protein [Bacteroidota bacterium]|nr:MAG: peptidase inhibitor family I36 protein [Bacteroidota bacterium]